MSLPPLPDAVAAALPPSTPAPPWRCRVDAVVWWHRARPSAAGAVGFPARTALPVTVGALLTYLDSPVGPYREVLGCPLLLRGGGLVRTTVPFIAVDSAASVAGGRTHWGLPKVLAAFVADGAESADAESADAESADAAVGDGWQLQARPAAAGPALPVAARFTTTQDGVRAARSRVRGRARFARVEVDGAGLPPWLVPGRHAGVVLTGAQLLVGAPR